MSQDNRRQWPERDARALSAPAYPPREVADYMASVNPVFQAMGMRLTEVREGYAEMVLYTRPDMGNTYGAVHGGIVFSLADMCFGMAANSRDQRAVTASAEIHYIAPMPLGEEVHAKAEETWLGARSGLYDVTLTDENGSVLALVRVRARLMDERVIPNEWTPGQAAGASLGLGEK